MTKIIPTDTPVEPTVSLLHLKTGVAPKLGQRAHGVIHYELLADTNRQTLFLRLVSNDGGGNFSPELVPFSRVLAVAKGLSADSVVSSRIFHPCFRGKSQNNAGFCCVILRAEGLLVPVEGKRYQHQVASDWEEWASRILTQGGKPVELPAHLAGDAQLLNALASAPPRSSRRKTQPEDN